MQIAIRLSLRESQLSKRQSAHKNNSTLIPNNACDARRNGHWAHSTMNWRRGLFRLWIVGTALFVLAVAYNSYDEIKTQFDAVAAKRKVASDLATDAKFADWVHQRFYSDMPREQFDKKITTANPITEPKVIAQLKAIITNRDTSRPLSEWTDDELRAHILYRIIAPTPNPWGSIGSTAAIALGIPLAVLILGSSLVWAFSGFAARRS